MKNQILFFCIVLGGQMLPAKTATAVIRPDYSQEKFWIALPARHDIGDSVAPGCTIAENEANAKADVFYVHPTVYLAGNAMNADLGDDKLNAKCDNCVFNQATEYNACCRVYAPRYRQGVLRCFTHPSPEGDAALDTAYADVKAAFEYYLEHYNNGRPIILAGHSQGARHVALLLKEFFDGKPLMKQLVAAYPIGAPIPKNYYSSIPVADSAGQTGCVITWNTMEWGTPVSVENGKYKGCICVNPLSWKTDTATCNSSLHKGGLPFGNKSLETQILESKISENVLWIRPAPGKNISGYGKLGKIYHVGDVNLFYENIRENAMLRVKNYCVMNDL